ncbi:Fatty acid export 1 protein, partial [Thalictrum thalictroides]
FSVRVHVDGSGTQASTSETETSLRHGGNASKLHVEGVVKTYPVDEEPVAEKLGLDETIQEQEVAASDKKTAKIHDFCLGIPFGGLVLSGGLIGSVFSRNLSTLGIGMLFGGGVLALSACSFKGWREGNSTMPFILGQAALSAVLLWKQLQTYFMTKKVFPSGFYALISAAMLCFYTYVMASGGNPPPKKLKGPWGNPTGKEVEGVASPTS